MIAAASDSASWRSLRDYESSTEAVAKLLRAGHDMLIRAPEPVYVVAAGILEPAGVQCSIINGDPARPGRRVLFGRSYVIAGFAFERIGTKDEP